MRSWFSTTKSLVVAPPPPPPPPPPPVHELQSGALAEDATSVELPSLRIGAEFSMLRGLQARCRACAQQTASGKVCRLGGLVDRARPRLQLGAPHTTRPRAPRRHRHRPAGIKGHAHLLRASRHRDRLRHRHTSSHHCISRDCCRGRADHPRSHDCPTRSRARQ